MINVLVVCDTIDALLLRNPLLTHSRVAKASHPPTYRIPRVKDNKPKQRIVNIFRETRVKKKDQKGHPTQKSLDICRRIIKGLTPKNSLVVDPFCGSGTILVAAKTLGRRYLGCDIDEKYVKLAQNWLANEQVAGYNFITRKKEKPIF